MNSSESALAKILLMALGIAAVILMVLWPVEWP